MSVFKDFKHSCHQYTLELGILSALLMDLLFYPLNWIINVLQGGNEKEYFFNWPNQWMDKLKTIYRNTYKAPNIFEFSFIRLCMIIPNVILLLFSFVLLTIVFFKNLISYLFYPVQYYVPSTKNSFDTLYFYFGYIPSIPEIIVEPESIGEMTTKVVDFPLPDYFSTYSKKPIMFAFSSSNDNVIDLVRHFANRNVSCFLINLIQSSSIHELINEYTSMIQFHLRNNQNNLDTIYFAGSGICGEICMGVLQNLLLDESFRAEYKKIHVYFDQDFISLPDQAWYIGMWSLYPFLSICWTIHTKIVLNRLQEQYSKEVDIIFENVQQHKTAQSSYTKGC